ncbi:MAG: hypothetical protein ACRD9Y_07255 [Blastocatellia bacterium]
MSKKLFLIVIALLFLPTAAAFAREGAPAGKSFVQSANEERLFTVTVYSAKPEKWSEALQFIKNEAVPANLKGGRKHMEVWTSVYGQSYESWFILPLENFAGLDKPDDVLLKGLGSREAVAAFWNKARSYNTSVRQFVIRVRPDESYIKPDAPTPRLAAIGMIEVMYGKEWELSDWVKAEMLPPVKKSGRDGEIRAGIVAGGVNGYIIFEPRENFAELDKPNPRTQVLGAEGVRKAMAKMPPGAITKIDRRTLVFRPDLSILPK